MLPLIQLVTLNLPDQAVFSGRTAAWLHGIDVPPCAPVEVTMPRLARTSRLACASVKRSDLLAGDVCEVNDVRAMSRIRTVADLGRWLPLVEGVVVLDMALHRRIVTLIELKDWLAAHGGYHGLKRLRFAMGLANSAAESPMETRLRLLLGYRLLRFTAADVLHNLAAVVGQVERALGQPSSAVRRCRAGV